MATKKKSKKPAKKVSRKPKTKKPAKKLKTIVVSYKPELATAMEQIQKSADSLGEWADLILKKPQSAPPKVEQTHAADQVDIQNIPLEELMNLAARECSCIRLQRAQGIKDGVCSGQCSHAKAIEVLSDRGIIA